MDLSKAKTATRPPCFLNASTITLLKTAPFGSERWVGVRPGDRVTVIAEVEAVTPIVVAYASPVGEQIIVGDRGALLDQRLAYNRRGWLQLVIELLLLAGTVLLGRSEWRQARGT